MTKLLLMILYTDIHIILIIRTIYYTRKSSIILNWYLPIKSAYIRSFLKLNAKKNLRLYE